MTSIVKSIEKHDYFDYIQRSHSSLSSLVKDAIKKPINMENIMNRINDGQIDSEIKLKNEILSLVLNYQILQNPDDSVNMKKFNGFLFYLENKFTNNNNNTTTITSTSNSNGKKNNNKNRTNNDVKHQTFRTNRRKSIQ